jgi:hypothetical protein
LVLATYLVLSISVTFCAVFARPFAAAARVDLIEVRAKETVLEAAARARLVWIEEKSGSESLLR